MKWIQKTTLNNNTKTINKMKNKNNKNITLNSNFDKDIVSLNQFGKTQQQLFEESKHLLNRKNEIQMKPFLKLWNEDYVEIKKNKPKKSKHIIMKMFDEILEIYGEMIGNVVGSFLLDMIEERYYHIDNKQFSQFNKIIFLNNRKKWTKTIINVNELLQQIGTNKMGLMFGNPNN